MQVWDFKQLTWNKKKILKNHIIVSIIVGVLLGNVLIWAATWQNQQNDVCLVKSQISLSRRWVHNHIVDFVVLRLISELLANLH